MGERHLDTAQSYHNLGATYMDLEEYNEAEKFYKKAHLIREDILGENSLAVSESYYYLGELKERQKRYAIAEYCYKKSLKIKEKILDKQSFLEDETHTKLAILYHEIGIDDYAIGDFNDAYISFEKALNIMKNILPIGHPNLINIEESLKATEEKLRE